MKKATATKAVPEPVEPAKPTVLPRGSVVAVQAAPFTPPPAYVHKKPKWS